MKKLFLTPLILLKKPELIFIFLTLFYSCSAYLPKNKQPINQESRANLTCSNSNGPEIFAKNSSVILEYKKVLSSIKHTRWQLSIVEEAVIFALVQMNFRPDISSPTSRLLIVIKKNNQISYFDFVNEKLYKENSLPLLSGLNHLLKKYNSPFTLAQLATGVDNVPNFFPTVSKDLASFITTNTKQLTDTSQFSRAFYRGNQPLRVGEAISRIKFEQVVSAAKNEIENFSDETLAYLFDYSIGDDSSRKVKCNYDFNLYKNSIYPIAKKPSASNNYGIKRKNGDMFIATTFQKLTDKILPTYDTFLVKGSYPATSKAICISEPSPLVHTILLSTSTRDPGQLLYDLINIGGDNAQSKKMMVELTNSPRHYFLMSPKRILYETSKATGEQIRNMQKNNIPIYHQRDIGDIISFMDVKHTDTTTENGFIIDSRSDAAIYCDK